MKTPANLFQNLDTGIIVEETSFWGDLVETAAKAKQYFAKRRERSRLRAQLMSLDDRMLKDIGLHRSDLPLVADGYIPENRLGLAANENVRVLGREVDAA